MPNQVLNMARRSHRKAAVQFAIALKHGNDEDIQHAECVLEEAALVVAAAWLGANQREVRKTRGQTK